MLESVTIIAIVLLCVLLADLSYKELSGRPKNLWGVYNKMHQKCQKLDSIYDLRAIRVIVRDKTDCYAVLRQVGCIVYDPYQTQDMFCMLVFLNQNIAIFFVLS